MPTPLSSADVLLADGSIAVVRALRPEDGPALRDLHARVSDDSLRMRFFSASRPAADRYVDHLLADPETVTLVAEVGGHLAAIATAEPIAPATCEVAFLVADDHRGLGLGTLLLEHLAAAARDRGVRRFRAEVLPENWPMLSVFRDAGFDLTQKLDHQVIDVGLDTGITPALQEAADDRECSSEARSLAPLLRPRSVAVVGVRRDGTGIGAAVLRSIRNGGFRGRLAVVHAGVAEVDGVPAYPSARDVPDGIDLAVLAVPADRAVTALEDAADAGADAAVVISSGFGELGDDGAAMQARLSDVGRRRGVRLIGPNCLGVMSNDPDVRLDATFGTGMPPAGGLAVGSQSGGVGIALMDLARELDLGVRYFVSLGNKADVSGNDLLAAWYDDDAVTAGALYLESFGNARKFARLARRFARRKPLLAVVGGRSSGGRRAGASHTAAAASPAVGVEALFAQSGVIGCTDAEDLAEAALLLTEQPLPAGRRIAVVSNAGGMGVLAADAAGDVHLELPEFSADLRARIAALVNGTTGTANPVDAGAGAAPAALSAILDDVLASGEVDAVLAVLVATGASDIGAVLAELAVARARHPGLPVAVVPFGAPDVTVPAGLTAYRSTAAALRALAHAAAYAAWLSIPEALVEASDPDRVAAARQVSADLLAAAEAEGGWVAPGDAAPLLAPYGLTCVGEVVTGPDATVAAADAIGYPVVVKAAGADVVHKTERHLVRVGLAGPEEVRRAVLAFEVELEHDATVLVQPVATGVEVALGVVRDEGLGPLVMVAAGGIATDVWDDRVFVLPPVTDADAARAVQGLRIRPLLEGFRGAPPADVTGLRRLLVALGRLAVDVPEVAEVDLNPVLVGHDTVAVVDLKLRLAATDDPGVPAPRQLRRVR